MSLHALMEKWRRYAIAFRDCGAFDSAELCDRHADELEAALAGGGEAVATVAYTEYVAARGEWRATVWTPTEIPARTPLFTHPAGAVQVTDDLHTRFVEILYEEAAATTEGGILRIANRLAAALNPGGSRE